MIKVYLDWNVISGMKNNFFPEFTVLIKEKQKYLLVFSPSHINDIAVSYSDDLEQKKIIQTDLDYITELTDNLCLHTSKNKLKLDYFDPNDLLNQTLETNSTFQDLSIEGLTNIFDDPVFKDGLESISSIPIDYAFSQGFSNPQSKELLNQLFPGLKDDLTLGGFFKAFSKMNQEANNNEGYKVIRDMVQMIGINSGHFSSDKNPFEIIDEAKSKIGLRDSDINKYFKNNNTSPEWFGDISSAYLNLDMFGYKSDEIKVNKKTKKTMRNTLDDSFHTAYASNCDVYITNDNKNIFKTKAVYEKLNVKTKVLKPKEFIEYSRKNYFANGFHEHFYEVLSSFSKEFIKQRFEGRSDEFLVYNSEIFIFNFFNKIIVPEYRKEGDPTFILSKNHPAKHYVIAYKEIEVLINYFYSVFDKDVNGKKEFVLEDIESENSSIREWHKKKFIIELSKYNDHIQLYYYS